jgi:guanine nucleotide-binding protein G(i) subunit alpha
MEDDSTSMIVHRDVDSLLSYYTGTSISSSKRSLVFEFDRELFTSRIYERWIRGSVKKSLREQQGDFGLPGERKLSLAIDRDLEEHAKVLRRECRVLLLGSESKSDIVKGMKIVHSKGYSKDELWNYRPTIFRNVVDNAKALVIAMMQFDIAPETEANRKHVEFLFEYQLEPISGLDPKFSEALSSVWRDPCIPALMERQAEFYLHESAE